MKKLLIWSLVIVLIILSYFIGYNFGIGNQTLRYGTSGYPKNCRALITENIKGVGMKEYTMEEAFGSINRNCGQYGYIWNER